MTDVIDSEGGYRRILSLPELVAMAATVCLVLLIPTTGMVWVFWSQQVDRLDVSRATLCKNALAVREVQGQILLAVKHLADANQLLIGERVYNEISKLKVAEEFVCEEVAEG